MVERIEGHRAKHDALMREVAAARLKLKFLPHEEFEQLYAKTNAEAVAAIRKREEEEEAGRFFNQPSAVADFAHWARADHWTIDEAIALLLGKSPQVVTWPKVQSHLGISAFANKFQELRDLARRSRSLGHGYAVEPAAVIAWAEEIEEPVPKELRNAVFARLARKESLAGRARAMDRLQAMLDGDGSLEAFNRRPAPSSPTVPPMFAAQEAPGANLPSCEAPSQVAQGPTTPKSADMPMKGDGQRKKPPQALRAQEEEILRTLRELGHEPKKLPPRPAGKPWVKSAVWREIGTCQLFSSERVFNKAWDRLRTSAEISERPGLK